MYTIHIGFDDHVSGYRLSYTNLLDLKSLDNCQDALDYIIDKGEYVETNEANLFLDMISEDWKEFKYQLNEIFE